MYTHSIRVFCLRSCSPRVYFPINGSIFFQLKVSHPSCACVYCSVPTSGCINDTYLRFTQASTKLMLNARRVPPPRRCNLCKWFSGKYRRRHLFRCQFGVLPRRWVIWWMLGSETILRRYSLVIAEPPPSRPPSHRHMLVVLVKSPAGWTHQRQAIHTPRAPRWYARSSSIHCVTIPPVTTLPVIVVAMLHQFIKRVRPPVCHSRLFWFLLCRNLLQTTVEDYSTWLTWVYKDLVLYALREV